MNIRDLTLDEIFHYASIHALDNMCGADLTVQQVCAAIESKLSKIKCDCDVDGSYELGYTDGERQATIRNNKRLQDIIQGD